MFKQLFKPGDRVKRKGADLVMMVNKYVSGRNPLLGAFQSYKDVECIWYEEGVRKSAILDQRTLVRTNEMVYQHFKAS